MSVEKLLADLQVKQFTGTREGIDLLEGDAELQRAVAAFATDETADVLSGHEVLGQGKFSVVAGIGDVAVKTATRETNQYSSSRFRRADNLIGQMTYMAALHEHFRQPALAEADLHVPEQFFALRTRKGNYLSAQQRMHAVEPLGIWDDRQGPILLPERAEVFGTIRDRILEAIPKGDDQLSIGLGDIKAPKPDYVHGGNILIPVETDNPHEGPLCIIDQPGQDDLGKAAARVAAHYLQRLSNGGRPILRRFTA